MYVDQGADARRLFWTWGPADNDQDHVGRDGGVLTVLLIGPYRRSAPAEPPRCD
ncbi:hypothetical protein ACFCX4_05375 [Kitasatospora sp. NPDC056327]|uniref:hypothetical protein n=1 Tax=Kitasatospora sp. NPDC056327 TaxID=3345785 RepID=UPI0035DC0D0F